MDLILSKILLVFLLIIPLVPTYGTDKKNFEKLNKLYMLYNLNNNLPKELETINAIKNLNLEYYYLLMTKYLLKIKKYEEANNFLKKMKEPKDKNTQNEVLLLKLIINEDNISEDEINELLQKDKALDIKIIYQLYNIARIKNDKISLRIKNIILKKYPKSIYSYKIKRNE
ncbi:hypothetical protein BmHG_00848 [Borrelia miyamotoi]|uniref:Uncharacterized protein n=1 Tax=Borrelia miyamotoi TaxID=47466 RepID=A0AAP8YU63_9SPIR|nr:hypothetical protein [Borrelia miyamotoi]AHH04566.1 Hypothetical protein BOM_0023 [Borrelia miyamotoi FR64b]ATQ14446.1 hypothetical protein CNO14_00100 [Borrelia miyamotoi]ATQ15631.1 hypothetical protein CNO13_00100 [Borrelia miyamotoi]ATQ16776.1 hypothetical protein CNO12_00100 [Borrelia miyamotoi]ATQ18721.1 hypothetical protein CNO11_04150 [Borrelia miyamotoi]